MSDAEGPTSYAIRLHQRAQRDIDEALLRLADLAGEQIAAEWREGLLDALATLAARPRRYPLAREDRLFRREVRQLVYRRTPGGPAYRALYTVYEADDEAPFVFVLHIRHGARRPLSRAEAGEIEAG